MNLLNPSRLLDKHRDELGRNLLIVNPMADSLASVLNQDGKQLTLVSHDFLISRQLTQSGFEVHFGCQPQLDKLAAIDAAVLYLPSTKPLAKQLMQWLASVLPQHTPTYIVGDNKGGIKSALKQMGEFYENASKYASGAHCQLLFGLSQRISTPALAASSTTISTPQGSLNLAGLPGVFSEGSLDHGTRLLLEHLPPLSGRILDFGCGAGIIGASIKQAHPDTDVEMLDINAFALECSQATLQANGLQAKVYASDGFSEVEGKFDFIISNPPFHHVGKQTLDTTERFIANAKLHLKPGGTLLFVANHHLPYGEAMNKAFGRVNLLAQDNKFKLYFDQNRS
ncbi:methyltransferase [Ferrimonas aestuarii]|uniref:Ribosomal RNA small subunit methyltransferase C n=1 Tax=Ferrimonas aestuarii TaxID=2569539 RepID=A0A4U1BKM7_9GAMM|nr:methyltransferase [Ferrimonas aestuarii]TKB53039.1 methyltransferase domain-containing protein [Ferrimonas aestuarii]